MRTEPVKCSAGALLEGWEPFRVMVIERRGAFDAADPEADVGSSA